MNPHRFKTIIIKRFNDRASAAVYEATIQKYLNVHINPLYINKGYFTNGHLVYTMSEQERKNINQKRIGFKHSEETRTKMSIAAKGRKHKESTKQLYRDGRRKGVNNPNYGKNLTEEHKEKIRLAQKGKICPQRGRVGRDSPNKGTNLSDATRQKMSKYIWHITYPNGTTISTELLADWCKQLNFRYDSVRPSFIKNGQYKGYCGIRVLKN